MSGIEGHDGNETLSRKLEGGLRSTGLYKKSASEKPLVSVITVVLNGEKYLEQTIQSVITQNYEHVEYIIIDGGSNDGTLDIIRKYEHAIDYWISEPDKGLFDAMNKGIVIAAGEIVSLLNSNDWYNDHAVIETVIQTFNSIACEVFCGTAKMVDDPGNFLYFFRSNSSSPYRCFPHQALFYKRQLHHKYGLYNPTFKLGADYDFFLRLRDAGIQFLDIDCPITNMRIVGNSAGKHLLIITEHFYIQITHNLPFIRAFTHLNVRIFKSSIRILLQRIGLICIVKVYRRLRWWIKNEFQL